MVYLLQLENQTLKLILLVFFIAGEEVYHSGNLDTNKINSYHLALCGFCGWDGSHS